MNRKGAISKFVLIGLLIISLVFVGLLSYLFRNEHIKCVNLQTQVDELTARQRVTEGKLEDSKKKVTELSLKLQEVQGQVTALSGELDQEKLAHQEASKELEQVKSDLDQQKTLRKDIENKLNQAQNDGRKIKEQIKVIEQQKADLDAKIKSLEASSAGVELGKVVVNNEAAAKNTNVPNPKLISVKAEKQADASQGKGLEGKVTVVNKEYNFAVINLGQKDGINLGDQFSVYRDGKVIGDVKVEKVHEFMSAAGFAEELKGVIKENDKVVQKAK